MSKLLINDFYQGSVKVSLETEKCLDDKNHGNCVTIALIKCALGEFKRIDNIFLSYESNAINVSVCFQDDFILDITNDEIEIVKNLSGIEKEENPQYYDSAIQLYTIICKRVFLEKEEYSERCVNNFTNAVEYINAGFNTKGAHKLLSLKKEPVRKLAKLKQFDNVVIWSNAHASYYSNGFQDIFGKAYKVKKRIFGFWMKNPRGLGGFIQGAYRLSK